ncbi:polysaccharide deacetylase family protein, partial [Fodinibius sp.]|uniref:polysaccharide deacetylase family protein n=1 Tax=Fodinibius sp. TaxID=1872440 RepID=UPI00356715F2
MLSCTQNSQVGQTEITKWQHDKKGAISITYDDGYGTQFKNAMPIMDRLGLPGTFFIVTGVMEGSEYRPKFLGRSVEEIIQDTKTIPTNEDNFFERASAVNYIGYKEAFEY